VTFDQASEGHVAVGYDALYAVFSQDHQTTDSSIFHQLGWIRDICLDVNAIRVRVYQFTYIHGKPSLQDWFLSALAYSDAT